MGYSRVVLIHSSDSDGRTTLGRFQNLADLAKSEDDFKNVIFSSFFAVKVETIIEYEPGISNIVQELEETKSRVCRTFILYANAEDAKSIFEEIVSRNMTQPNYVWLVSEQALLAPNRPNGVLALKLNSLDESSMISDSVQVLANALKEMYISENITAPPTDCSKIATSKWQSGIKFLQYLKNQTFNGKTGRIAFDEYGDRLLSDYEIINIVNGKEEIVGKYTFSKTNMKMDLYLNENRIVWPGNQTDIPLGE